MKKKISCFAILIFLGYLFSRCYSYEKGPGIQIDKIYQVRKIPIVATDGKMEEEIYDSICIIYYKDFRIYQLPVEYTEANVRVIEGSDTVPGQLIDSLTFKETRYDFFIQKEGKPYGYLSLPELRKTWKRTVGEVVNPVEWKKINADSILNLKVTHLNFGLVRQIATLVSTSENDKAKELVQVYVSKNINADTDCDTTYLYFKPELTDIAYSYSPVLDSLMKSKLYKIRLLYNARMSNVYNVWVPEREWLFEMGKIPVEDMQGIAGFMETAGPWFK